MLVTTKRLAGVEEQFDLLAKKVQEQTLEVVRLKEAQTDLVAELDDSRQAIVELTETLRGSTDLLKQTTGQLNNEVVELKLYFASTKKEFAHSLTEQFSHELKQTTSTLNADLEGFKRLKNRVEELERDASSMSNEVAKFLAISSDIKKSDFELSKYGNILDQNDKQKLELMKRIESMERMVAKMRMRT